MKLSRRFKVCSAIILALLLFPVLSCAAQGKPDSALCPFGKWIRDSKNKQWICNEEPLPVTVTSFTARVIANNLVKVEWTVTNIVNHYYYIVEYSTDAMNWEPIRETASYSIKHRTNSHENYYRLVSVDMDGRRHTYNIIFCRVNDYRDYTYDILGRRIEEKQVNKLLIINGQQTIIKQ